MSQASLTSLKEGSSSEKQAIQSRKLKLLNNILAVFGLKATNIEENANDYKLYINEEAFGEAISLLAKNLKTESDNSIEASEAFKAESKALCEEAELARAEASKLRSELNGQLNTVAQNVQNMLRLSGEKTSLTESLTSMLDELGMKAVWHDWQSQTDPAKFTVLKSPNPEMRKGKPCILSGEQVIAKGLVFIAEERSF